MKLLLAVSGGVDSMCLIKKLKQDHQLAIIHINHQTRGMENVKESKLIKNYAEQNKIPFFEEFYSSSNKTNFHQEARDFRYRKYKEFIESQNCVGVVLGHHLDDQLENILLFKEKIGPKLMKFKTKINDIYVFRPFLGTYKEELYAYASKNNIPFLEDSSNQSDKYLRNKIRYHLKDYSQVQKEELYRQELIRELKLKEIQQEFSQKISKQKNLNFSRQELDSLEKIYMFLKVNGIKSNISKRKLFLIDKKIKYEKNVKISIDKDNILIISYQDIYVVKRNKQSNLFKNDKQKTVSGINRYNYLEFVYNKCPGMIRTYKTGDIWVKEIGQKKVRRFFIDQKIEKVLRKKWPIIVDDEDQIIWIPTKEDVTVLKNLGEYFDGDK